MEDAFVHIAEKSQTPTIILCDRGALDTKLFVREADFVNLRCALGYEDENKLLERYDAVVHLVTPQLEQKYIILAPTAMLHAVNQCSKPEVKTTVYGRHG